MATSISKYRSMPIFQSFVTLNYRLPKAVEISENFLEIAEKTETLSKKSDETHVKNNLRFLAGKLRSFVPAPSQAELENQEPKILELSSVNPSSKTENENLEPLLKEKTIGVPEIAKFTENVLDDQTAAVKRAVDQTEASGSVLKKLRYDLKYESKLDYRNFK